ncbi:MAG: PP2C family protein-serine/threonine phosphatase [Betaproteobacteria bacterium]
MNLPPPRSASGKARYRVNACTADHIGDRSEQQDRVALISSPRNPGALLAVLADGMGGRTGGRLASDQVVATATSLFQELSAQDADPRQLLEQVANEAHTVIRLTALSAEKEPHSTMVALLLHRDHAAWAHAGDSRLYVFRHGKLRHCTEDHSYASRIRAEAGAAVAERYRHMLVSALGLATTPQVTFAETSDLGPGDVFLLCSDGLWCYFAPEELGAMLNALPPREAAAHLLRMSRDRAGGRGDNVSLAIVKLEPPPETASMVTTLY